MYIEKSSEIVLEELNQEKQLRANVFFLFENFFAVLSKSVCGI